MKLRNHLLKLYRWRILIFPFIRYGIQILPRMGRKTIWIIGSPSHSNLGDQAQSYCLEQLCRTFYPGYRIVILEQFTPKFGIYILRMLRSVIGSEDMIFCHSGYHMTEMYPLYQTYLLILKMFPDYPVTIFPQTINFQDPEIAAQVARTMDAHPDCTLMCRDQISHANAFKLFSRTHLLLYPDVVTSLIGTYRFSYPREGILFCMRNDPESFYAPAEIAALQRRFAPIAVQTADTTVKISARYIAGHRKEVLEKTFEQYAHYKVTITDRYHGMIFSLIAGTPVVVVNSRDHKLASGVKWFPRETFGSYLAFAEDLEKAYQLAEAFLRKPPTIPPPVVLREKYYTHLDQMIHRKIKDKNEAL